MGPPQQAMESLVMGLPQAMGEPAEDQNAKKHAQTGGMSKDGRRSTPCADPMSQSGHRSRFVGVARLGADVHQSRYSL